jgi:hypothetical protein
MSHRRICRFLSLLETTIDVSTLLPGLKPRDFWAWLVVASGSPPARVVRDLLVAPASPAIFRLLYYDPVLVLCYAMMMCRRKSIHANN